MPCDITYNWNLIYSTNELFHRTENHGLENRLWLLGERGREWEGLGV